MKYITTMGGIWRVSDKNFRALRKEARETGAVADLDRYGKMILADPIDLADLIDSEKATEE